MSNCIDCKWLVRWWADKNNKEQFVECSKANPDVRDCEDFESAKRKIIKLEDNEDYKLKILCDKVEEVVKETNKLLDGEEKK